MKNKTDNINSMVKKSLRFVRSQISSRPKIAVILGSGLGDFGDLLSHKTVIETSTIPYYPVSTVTGHKGNLIFGKLSNISVLAFQGRVHYYESGDLDSILYPIRLANSLGIKTLIVTNAAGGVNRLFKPGDLMLITDQINLTFENPFRKMNTEILHRELYNTKLLEIIRQVAQKNNIKLCEGIYCGIKGPSYETAAEINMIQKFGVDAVGMSTVNEVSLAVTLGMSVAGISCITNMSTGILNQKLSHQEVTDVANLVKQTFSQLLQSIIQNIK